MIFNSGSINWLSIVLGIFGSLRGKLLRRVVKVKQYVRDLRELEAISGNSNLFVKLRKIADGEEGVEINQADAIYMVGDRSGDGIRDLGFFGIWHKYFKKPIQTAANLFDNEKPLGELFDALDPSSDDADD